MVIYEQGHKGGVMKVEELRRYGIPFLEPPKKGARMAINTLLRIFRKKMGIIGSLLFLFESLTEGKIVRKEFPEQIDIVNSIDPGMGKMVSIYVSIFRLLSKKFGRKEASGLMTAAIKPIGEFNIPLIYQSKDLAICEGDLFENFKKFNHASFESCKEAGVIDIAEYYEDETSQIIVVNRCDGCTIGELFGWPEIGMLGCDHDIGGFPKIEDELQIVFRRHKTLAKGDDCCDFTFYKKGFEPKTKKALK